MGIATQPNGSTMIPVAGAPQTTSGISAVTAQSQNTLVVYHKSGSTNVKSVSVIQS